MWRAVVLLADGGPPYCVGLKNLAVSRIVPRCRIGTKIPSLTHLSPISLVKTRILRVVKWYIKMLAFSPGQGVNSSQWNRCATVKKQFGDKARPTLYAAYRAAKKPDGPNGSGLPAIPRAELAAMRQLLQRLTREAKPEQLYATHPN